MRKALWTTLLAQMAEYPLPVSIPVHCICCWNEQHSTPFPAHFSSSLCPRHAALTWHAYQEQKAVRA